MYAMPTRCAVLLRYTNSQLNEEYLQPRLEPLDQNSFLLCGKYQANRTRGGVPYECGTSGMLNVLLNVQTDLAKHLIVEITWDLPKSERW